MKVTYGPTRQTIPLFFEHDGKKFVRFLMGTNFEKTVELPDNAKVLSFGDLIEPNRKK